MEKMMKTDRCTANGTGNPSRQVPANTRNQNELMGVRSLGSYRVNVELTRHRPAADQVAGAAHEKPAARVAGRGSIEGHVKLPATVGNEGVALPQRHAVGIAKGHGGRPARGASDELRYVDDIVVRRWSERQPGAQRPPG